MTAPWIGPATNLVRLSAAPQPRAASPEHAAKVLLGHDDFGACVNTGTDLRVDKFVELIRRVADHDLFHLFAYQPDDVIATVVPQLHRPEWWATAVDLYEAWWLLASTDQLPAVHKRGQRVATAFLARTRWRLLSLPYRSTPTAVHIDQDDLNLIDGTTDRLLTRARQARDDWTAVLDTAEDRTLLTRTLDIEDEVLDLASVPLGGGGTPDTVDQAVWRHCVRHHLLPRFAVPESAQIVAQIVAEPRTAWTRLVTRTAKGLAALGVVLALAAMTGRVPGGITAASAVAGATYLMIGAAAVGERATSWPWLLRQPASAVLGLLALVSLTPHWWHRGYANPAAAAGVLAAGSVCYLAVEAVNHGVGPTRVDAPTTHPRRGVSVLPERIGTVAAIGLVHATLVSTIALRWVLPVFGDTGQQLKCLWGSHAHFCQADILPAWAVLTLTIGWSFAAGVFSQILWDEQPVTAPLAHIRWTGRR